MTRRPLRYLSSGCSSGVACAEVSSRSRGHQARPWGASPTRQRQTAQTRPSEGSNPSLPIGKINSAWAEARLLAGAVAHAAGVRVLGLPLWEME